jgi:hypothetical protein
MVTSRLRRSGAALALLSSIASVFGLASPAGAWQTGSLYALGDATPAAGPVWATERPSATVTRADGSVIVVGDRGTIWAPEGETNLGDPGAPVVDAAATAAGVWGLTNDGRLVGTAVPTGAGTIGAVSLAVNPTETGGWIAHRDGTVTPVGDAPSLSTPIKLNAPIVDIVSTGSGAGYWLVSSDGGVFSFGDAPFPGSLAGRRTGPISAAVGIGGGLWVLASNGTTYSLGAPFAPAPGAISPVSGFFAVDLTTSNNGAIIVTAHSVRPDRMLQPLPADGATGRRIVYSNSLQQVWVIDENNAVVRSYLVSGKVATPAPGRYRVQSKSAVAYARSGSAWMRWMVRFQGGIGFHQIPQEGSRPMQVETELGYFRSHGCVRQAASDAEFLYGWATVGTPVIVVR